MSAGFYLSELVLATPFGIVSDRVGHHRVMQAGPVFGFAAAVLTGLSRFLTTAGATLLVPVLTVTRALEGTSTAASVPSILGYVAAATAGNEELRGRSAALFETATLGGLGAGFIVAPKLFEWVGTTAFFLNAVVYVVSLLIFRVGVSDPRADAIHAAPQEGGWRRYGKLLGNARGAAAGADLDRRQRGDRAVVQPVHLPVRAARRPVPQPAPPPRLRRERDHARGDRHHGSSSGPACSTGAVASRTCGAARSSSTASSAGAVVVASCLVINHSADMPLVVPVAFAGVAAAGLFVLAGATPAALGLLADISGRFPDDRGAIMGLYSVFLAMGQIVGSLVGGVAATMRGIDGLLVATLVHAGHRPAAALPAAPGWSTSWEPAMPETAHARHRPSATSSTARGGRATAAAPSRPAIRPMTGMSSATSPPRMRPTWRPRCAPPSRRSRPGGATPAPRRGELLYALRRAARAAQGASGAGHDRRDGQGAAGGARRRPGGDRHRLPDGGGGAPAVRRHGALASCPTSGP